MKKVLLIVAIFLSVGLLSGCGRTPEQKAAENLLKNSSDFMQDIVELGEAHDKGEITDEEMAKSMMGEYSDMIIKSAEGTDDELSPEEQELLKEMMGVE